MPQGKLPRRGEPTFSPVIPPVVRSVGANVIYQDAIKTIERLPGVLERAKTTIKIADKQKRSVV